MALRLSTDELHRLQQAQTVLLSPLAYSTPESWGAAACDAVRALVGGSETSLFVASEGAALWFTTLSEAATRDFLTHYAGVDPVSTRVIAEGIECGCAWDVVERHKFHRSEFYNEFAGPNGLHDAMGLRIPVGPRSHRWLTVQHSRPLPEPEVRRRVAMMRLVLPAFKSGSRFAASLPFHDGHLARLVDHLPYALAVFTVGGRELYRNAAMERLLKEAPGATVEEGVEGLLRALSALWTREEPAPEGLLKEIVVGGRHYQLSGQLAEEGGFGREPVLLVRVDVAGPDVLRPDELRRRFGLTPREVEVALLLARRRTNREIAETLQISPHTAERHTERILSKLGVASRLEVTSRLAGDIPSELSLSRFSDTGPGVHPPSPSFSHRQPE